MSFVDLEADWEKVASQFMPVVVKSSPWRQNGAAPANLRTQGWKIHVSATIHGASEALETVGPLLRESGVHYKGVATLTELKRINCGLFYGYSQVGKFLTIYPPSDEQAVELARALADAVRGMPGPSVPFERQVARDSPVFARYGLFRRPEDGTGLQRPDGSLQPDDRHRDPDWASPPPGLFADRPPAAPGPLAHSYRVYECLSQRGKGGVYRALDLSVSPARKCIVKEGRRWGESDPDGNDGHSRLIREALCLDDLAAAGIDVPEIYGRFEENGNRYLALENIDGGKLIGHLLPGEPELDRPEMLTLALKASQLLDQIHKAGWIWRDLKAANVIRTPEGDLRPIDFEGAIRLDEPLTSPWGSTGHVPDGWAAWTKADPFQDTYALGALIRQLATGKIAQPDEEDLLPQSDPEVAALVADLMSSDCRATAAHAVTVLEALTAESSLRQGRLADHLAGRIQA